jgi:hypothetical protein
VLTSVYTEEIILAENPSAFPWQHVEFAGFRGSISRFSHVVPTKTHACYSFENSQLKALNYALEL